VIFGFHRARRLGDPPLCAGGVPPLPWSPAAGLWGELRVGRWCVRWLPASGPFRAELLVGRYRRGE
jgi:hypothetical protein